MYIAHYHSTQGLKVISNALCTLCPWIKQEMTMNAKKNKVQYKRHDRLLRGARLFDALTRRFP